MCSRALRRWLDPKAFTFRPCRAAGLDLPASRGDTGWMNSIVNVPLSAIKGRGAASRIAHRFEKEERHSYDDGWDALEEHLAPGELPPQTDVMREDPRSAISSNDSPDVFFERSINPYRGCEHGCIYC